MQRHIYSKDPVQAAYTAGLFWLFQNAVVKNILLTDTRMSLDFMGNRKWISSRVSIPQTSALIMFVRYVLIVIIAALVASWARTDHAGSVTQLSPQEVAGTIVNPSQY